MVTINPNFGVPEPDGNSRTNSANRTSSNFSKLSACISGLKAESTNNNSNDKIDYIKGSAEYRENLIAAQNELQDKIEKRSGAIEYGTFEAGGMTFNITIMVKDVIVDFHAKMYNKENPDKKHIPEERYVYDVTVDP